MGSTASASPSPSPSLSASTPLQFSSLLEANTYRVKAIVERLTFIMNSKSGAFRFDSSEFFNLCIALARGVDYALTINDVPGVAHRLPSLIKQVYQRRNESYLQPAIMVLLISVKNACKKGWFFTADADELLNMTNELFSIFCMTMSVTPIVDHAQDIILKLVSRFYPQFKMCSLLTSLEAKPGYEVLLSDFQIPRNIPPEQKIMLIAVRTDNLETSSCIISPPQVSFLVNGKGVDRRTNISLDNGPQFPTDITKMLKFGTNIIQAIGYFTGTYLIALVFMNKITLSNSPILKDYAQPVVATVGVDSEIIEGASRITLNCPISFRRIKTPVKGHLCKHHQCFDYDNFMEMNSRKPSWRCPFCNQPVSFIDLRIDRNMVKILKEVGEDVIDVVISSDGSWKAVDEHAGNKNQLHRENLPGEQDCNIECTSTGSANALAVTVDLTKGEDGKSDIAMSPKQVGPRSNSVSQSENHVNETEDRKPFKGTHEFSASQCLAETPLPNLAAMPTPASSQLGNVMWPSMFSSSTSNASFTHTSQDASAVVTSESFLPAVLVNPVVTDAISPTLSPEPLASFDASQPNFSCQQTSEVRPLTRNMQLQSFLGNSMISHEPEELPIPRHVNRTPIAVQALPVQTQPSTSFKRMRIHGPSSSSLNSNDYSSATYQTVHPMTTIPGGLPAASGDKDTEHFLSSSDLSMSQDRDPQSRPQHVVSLPAQNLMSTRTPSSLQRGAGAYRASLQSPSDTPTSLVSPVNVRNPQASLIMPGSYRSNAALPLGATRELARQVAQQRVQLQAGASNPQASRIASTDLRLSVEEPSRNIAELPPDKNWRPTGRMRGSLTGSAYSAALTQYAVPTTATKPAGPPVPSVPPSTSDKLPSRGSGVVSSQGPVAEQAALQHKDLDSHPGGCSI